MRQVVKSESSRIHILHGRPGRKPARHRMADLLEEKTVFGRHYLGIAVDEAHGFCEANKMYGAVRALREKTDILVAMTVTPLKMRPQASSYMTDIMVSDVLARMQELWNVGKAIGLRCFDDNHDDEQDEMNKAVDEAKCE